MSGSVLALIAAISGGEFTETYQVRHILLHAVVSTRRDGFTTGLETADFTLTVDGEPVAIESLREVHHPVGEDASATTPERAGPKPPALPPRHVVFVFDLASVKGGNQTRMWRTGAAAGRWMRRHLSSGDRVSVVRFDGHMRVLLDDQPYTPDVEPLLAGAARALPGGRFDSSILTDGFFDNPADLRAEEQNREMLADIEDSEDVFVVRNLMKGLQAIARGLGQLRGRKAVFLLSHGHPMATMTSRPGSRMSSADLRFFTDRVRQEFRAADAAIYSLHTAGLDHVGALAADRPVGFQTAQRFFADGLTRTIDDVWSDQELLGFFARETGGELVRNRASLDRGLERLSRDLTSYYELGFAAPAHQGKGERGYHRLRLKVSRSGAKVRHRAGYHDRGL